MRHLCLARSLDISAVTGGPVLSAVASEVTLQSLDQHPKGSARKAAEMGTPDMCSLRAYSLGISSGGGFHLTGFLLAGVDSIQSKQIPWTGRINLPACSGSVPSSKAGLSSAEGVQYLPVLSSDCANFSFGGNAGYARAKCRWESHIAQRVQVTQSYRAPRKGWRTGCAPEALRVQRLTNTGLRTELFFTERLEVTNAASLRGGMENQYCYRGAAQMRTLLKLRGGMEIRQLWRTANGSGHAGQAVRLTAKVWR